MKQTIITILFVLVSMAGLAQNWSPLVEDSIDFIITGTTNSTQDRNTPSTMGSLR